MSKYKIDTTFISSKGYSVGYEEHECYPVFVLNRETDDKEVISDNVFDAITEHALYTHGIWKASNGALVIRAPGRDDEDGRCVLVIDDGSALQWVREGCVHHSDRWWHVAAREYFKKHPEPKPWHSAKDQQWWKVKHENVGLEFACVIESNGELEFVFGNGLGVAITSPCIEHAELIE